MSSVLGYKLKTRKSLILDKINNLKTGLNIIPSAILDLSADSNKELANTDHSKNVGNEKSTKRRNTVIYKKPQPSESFICDQCPKIFSKEGSLKSHKNLHSRSVKCDKCPRTFHESSHLKMKEHSYIHTGEKPHSCDQCHMRFASAGNLNRHRLRVHVKEKTVKCDKCPYLCFDVNDLKIHTRTHTGEKPFKCNHCSKVFAQSCQLKSHKLTHTGVKPFSCDLCSKTFSDPSNLRNHRKKHTGEKSFSCDICSKSFFEAGNLKQHIRIHSGEKPYNCDECSKSFSQNHELKTHKIRHRVKWNTEESSLHI